MGTTRRPLLAALIIILGLLLTSATPALAAESSPAPTEASSAERVSAEVLPAVMYIQIDVTAWPRSLATGAYGDELELSSTCTGFAVNPNGVLATAGHCVHEEDLLRTAADQWAQQSAVEGYDYWATYNSYIADNVLEGSAAGSPPQLTITAFPATSDGQASTGMPAQVVDKQTNAEGDVALLKVDATDLPTVEVVGSQDVNTGTELMSVGYPASRDAVANPSLEPSWKDGSVGSRQTNERGVPVLEVTSNMGPGMSGGPAVTMQGQVIGINSMGASTDGDTSNFVAPSSGLLDMMARNGVRAEAGPVDLAYRAGLDDYFSGQYSEAAEKFQTVLDRQPDNVMAGEYRSKALGAYERFGDAGSLGPVGWLAVGGGVAVVLVLAIVLLVRRGRRRGADPAGTRPTTAPLAPDEVSQPRRAEATTEAHAGFGTPPFGSLPAGPPSPPIGFPAPTTAPTGSDTADPPPTGGTAVDTAHVATVAPNPPEAQSPRFCTHCGTRHGAGSAFCGGCGRPI